MTLCKVPRQTCNDGPVSVSLSLGRIASHKEMLGRFVALCSKKHAYLNDRTDVKNAHYYDFAPKLKQAKNLFVFTCFF